MIPHPLRLALLATGLALAAHAQTPSAAPEPAPATLADTLVEIRKTIDARLASVEAGAEVPHRFDWTALDGQFEDLSANLAELSPQDAKNRLRNLATNLKSPEAKALVARLTAAVDAEKSAAERARLAALETRLTDFSRAALAATKVTELDPLFTQLEDFESELNNQPSSPALQRLRNAINKQQNFLQQWQTLLEAVADGARQSFNNAANNLGNGGYSRPHGVDRAAIRARIAELRATLAEEAESTDLLATATLADLPAIKTRLTSQNDGQGWNIGHASRQQLVSVLDQLETATLARDAGDSEQAMSFLTGSSGVNYGGNIQSPTYLHLQRLRATWLAESLPALTGLADFAPLAAGESPAAYLRRLHTAADAVADWPRAAALARLQRLTRPIAPWILGATPSQDDPTLPYLALFAGQRLEAAGQPAAAADQYRAALVANPLPKLAAHLTARLQALTPPTP